MSKPAGPEARATQTHRDADHYERTARIAARAGARTCCFSPELDRLFLAMPERGGRDAELRVYQPEN